MSQLRFGTYALPSYNAVTDGSQGEYLRSLNEVPVFLIA